MNNDDLPLFSKPATTSPALTVSELTAKIKNNLENELPADTEQCPPLALQLGLDHEDFLAALAPKPIVLLTQEKDYFDVRGSDQAFQRLQNLYLQFLVYLQLELVYQKVFL